MGHFPYLSKITLLLKVKQRNATTFHLLQVPLMLWEARWLLHNFSSQLISLCSHQIWLYWPNNAMAHRKQNLLGTFLQSFLEVILKLHWNLWNDSPSSKLTNKKYLPMVFIILIIVQESITCSFHFSSLSKSQWNSLFMIDKECIEDSKF